MRQRLLQDLKYGNVCKLYTISNQYQSVINLGHKNHDWICNSKVNLK